MRGEADVLASPDRAWVLASLLHEVANKAPPILYQFCPIFKRPEAILVTYRPTRDGRGVVGGVTHPTRTIASYTKSISVVLRNAFVERTKPPPHRSLTRP